MNVNWQIFIMNNNLVRELNNWNRVESTLENQWEIMDAIDVVLWYGNRLAEVYIVINDQAMKAYISFCKQSLDDLDIPTIKLTRDESHKWNNAI